MKLKLENIVSAVKDGLNTERGQELVEKNNGKGVRT
jgi:hypothetical protein